METTLALPVPYQLGETFEVEPDPETTPNFLRVERNQGYCLQGWKWECKEQLCGNPGCLMEPISNE